MMVAADLVSWSQNGRQRLVGIGTHHQSCLDLPIIEVVENSAREAGQKLADVGADFAQQD
jgi:hypothetical protein